MVVRQEETSDPVDFPRQVLIAVSRAYGPSAVLQFPTIPLRVRKLADDKLAQAPGKPALQNDVAAVVVTAQLIDDVVFEGVLEVENVDEVREVCIVDVDVRRELEDADKVVEEVDRLLEDVDRVVEEVDRVSSVDEMDDKGTEEDDDVVVRGRWGRGR